MSAVLSSPDTEGGTRSVHDISVMAMRCQIAVFRNPDGKIVRVQAIKADDKRRAMIDAAGRGIAQGISATEAMLNATAFQDICRELVRIEVAKS